ncbi:AAA family ATPase [Sutcliffiella cohnii]
MYIKFVEIENYRKLKSTRIEFTDRNTLFVGANNSGKTSAMEALITFLDEKNNFTINDFTLSNWLEINSIGEKWISDEPDFSEGQLNRFLPTMDVWLHVEDNEIHYVTHLIPTLDWDGGQLGVRLRFEPKSMEGLYKDFVDATKIAKGTLDAVEQSSSSDSIILWPRDLKDYLNRKLHKHFSVKAYILDPSKCVNPYKGIAQPQTLPFDSEAIDGDPFKSLFLVHKINAQRGFSDPFNKANEDEESKGRIVGNLTSQLKKYYNTHLNPTKSPDPTDIDALLAIETAQSTFDYKLKEGFKSALDELESLGYPGVSNPKITISTKLEPIDGLNHNTAVQYELMDSNSENKKFQLRLPEQYNGLGYQNLISIIFKLMRFRDEWLRVGKAGTGTPKDQDDIFIPPLHIVLIEEPEAHLHIQVQQVFIRHAYKVLCNHPYLQDQSNFTTQLIVSTHSSHIAHEMPFASLRYFRRVPAPIQSNIPTSIVVNLSNVFGKGNETERFVTRYLQSTHCDLFFADAAILVEGPAERMLVPHFIRHTFPELNQKYISLLEIGGSHAHRLRSLIEHIGIPTLIITDLDSIDPKNNNMATLPQRDQGFLTGNDTLKSWVPGKIKIDELLNLKFEEKVKLYNDENYSVRAAFQHPLEVAMLSKDRKVEAIPYTFEDAIVYENLSLFKSLEGNGLIKKFRNAIKEKETILELGEQFFSDLKKGKKAEFALELIYLQDPKELSVPTYIKDGLSWLDEQLQTKGKIGGNNQDNKEIEVEEVVEI